MFTDDRLIIMPPKKSRDVHLNNGALQTVFEANRMSISIFTSYPFIIA